jgi:hypothetical protein
MKFNITKYKFYLKKPIFFIISIIIIIFLLFYIYNKYLGSFTNVIERFGHDQNVNDPFPYGKNPDGTAFAPYGISKKTKLPIEFDNPYGSLNYKLVIETMLAPYGKNSDGDLTIPYGPIISYDLNADNTLKAPYGLNYPDKTPIAPSDIDSSNNTPRTTYDLNNDGTLKYPFGFKPDRSVNAPYGFNKDGSVIVPLLSFTFNSKAKNPYGFNTDGKTAKAPFGSYPDGTPITPYNSNNNNTKAPYGLNKDGKTAKAPFGSYPDGTPITAFNLGLNDPKTPYGFLSDKITPYAPLGKKPDGNPITSPNIRYVTDPVAPYGFLPDSKTLIIPFGYKSDGTQITPYSMMKPTVDPKKPWGVIKDNTPFAPFGLENDIPRTPYGKNSDGSLRAPYGIKTDGTLNMAPFGLNPSGTLKAPFGLLYNNPWLMFGFNINGTPYLKYGTDILGMPMEQQGDPNEDIYIPPMRKANGVSIYIPDNMEVREDEMAVITGGTLSTPTDVADKTQGIYNDPGIELMQRPETCLSLQTAGYVNNYGKISPSRCKFFKVIGKKDSVNCPMN